MTFFNDESVQEIIKDIDCVQETQQYSVTIEHNWSINEICDLIQSKSPGEKIESEKFSYLNNNSNHKKQSTASNSSNKSCNNNQIKKQTISDKCSPMISTSLSIQQEILCDYFINNSLWRTEIARSTTDPEYVSVNVQLLHNIIDSAKCYSLEMFQHKKSNFMIKFRFFLFNAEMNEVFDKFTLDVKLDMMNFFSSLIKSSEQHANRGEGSTRVVERFAVDKFCKIKDLLKWLNQRRSSDFCLLSEFKIYNQPEKLNKSKSMCFDSTNRLKSKFDSNKRPDVLPKSSSFTSSSNSFSSSPPPPLDQPNSILIHSYKHAWTIKEWRNFLMPGGSQSHTFMNDSEILNIFSQLDQDTSIEKNENLDSIQLGRFRSKLFNLTSSNSEDTIEDIQCDKYIKHLLEDVKWKLQLYPNGYSPEYEQNLSLFVNFSQLTGDLAQFSQPSPKKKSHLNLMNLRVNNSKVIEETFYDKDPNTGLVLLIKSPTSSSNTLEKVNHSIDSGDLSVLDEVNFTSPTSERKRVKKLANLYETFVKASFQISILDSNGKKVDKCQSEKQLFELFGSWGYKEYMTVKDLISFREKYLTNDCTTLNLNCKIVLFYTVTVKSNPNYSMQMTTFQSPIVEPLKEDCELSSVSSDLEQKSETSISTGIQKMDVSPTSKMKIKKNLELNRPAKSDMCRNECNSLLYDLRRVLKQSDMYDLIIRVPVTNENNSFDAIDFKNEKNFKQFKVHKFILSIRSEVFEKMFNSQTYETNEINQRVDANDGLKFLDIIDFDAFTVEVFLNYLYTDTLDINFTNSKLQSKLQNINKKDIDIFHTNFATMECDESITDCDDDEETLIHNELCTHLFVELFKISDKYCVYRLKQICELQLLKYVNVETTVELLILGYMHNSSKLKAKCFESLAENVSTIINQAAWVHLEKNFPVLLAEAFRVLYLKRNK